MSEVSAEVLDSLRQYVDSLSKMLATPGRKLSDDTPVSGFSGDELSALMNMLTDHATKTRFLGCYELKGKANPYIVIMIGLLPILKMRAEQNGKALLWASTTSLMDSRAQLNFMSLMAGLGLGQVPWRFVRWGDLAIMYEREPAGIRKAIVLGDADFEAGNSAGIIGSTSQHAETLRGIRTMAADPGCDMIVFHREGLKLALDLKAIGDLMAKRTTASAEKKKACFIATAAFASSQHPDVETLRKFRDEVLQCHVLGRSVIYLYERLSPPIARAISTRPRARQLTRSVLVRPLAKWAAARLDPAGGGDPGNCGKP